MPHVLLPRAPLLIAAALFFASPLRADDWPGWRGPTGMGQTRERGLPVEWNKDGRNILWKAPLVAGDAKVRLDHNQSSPVILGGRVFVTLSYWPMEIATQQFSEHHIACFNAADGKRLWDSRVEPGKWLLNDFRGGGYGCPSPAVDGERVYVVFGSAVIAALDHQGKLVWRKELDPKNFDVTIGASPVLYGDTVLMMCDRVGGKSNLIAFARALAT